MIIGLLTVRMSLPEARSLKDKRSVLRSLRDRVCHHKNVSVAEVGQQDLWQSAEMAFVTVAARREVVEKRLSDLQSMMSGNPRLVVLSFHTELL